MRCAAVQERLADEGAGLIRRDAAIGEHVAGCADCGPFLEALERVDAGLSGLSPVPAPASLIARTAKAVACGWKSASRHGTTDPGARKLATALAATVILAAGFGLVESVQQELGWAERIFADQLSGSFEGKRFGSLDEAQAPTVTAKLPATLRSQSPSAVHQPSLS